MQTAFTETPTHKEHPMTTTASADTQQPLSKGFYIGLALFLGLMAFCIIMMVGSVQQLITQNHITDNLTNHYGITIYQHKDFARLGLNTQSQLIDVTKHDQPSLCTITVGATPDALTVKGVTDEATRIVEPPP